LTGASRASGGLNAKGLTPMDRPLRVLIVEDNQADAELMVRLLRKAGYQADFERVDTPESMRAALARASWDLVLSDYRMPQFSAPEALAILKQSGFDMPFIVVSGGIGEATAVAAMKAGAHDYLMKDNLARLVPAVERELREADNRAAKRRTSEALRESELRYRLLWETATDAILLMDTQSTIHFANPAVEDVFGYRPEELIGQNLSLLQPEQLRATHRHALERYLATGEKRLNWRATEMPACRKDGVQITVEVAFSDMEFEGRRCFVGFVRDVSERKRTEKALRESQEQFRVAQEIQQHLFPKEAPAIPGLDIAGVSHPAEAMGGDYFDYLPMRRGCLGIVVGDVTGHGIGPALLMAETRAYLRLLAQSSDDVGEIMTRANAVLAQDVGTERFVTLLLAQIDPDTRILQYVNAGHPAGYVFGASGEIRMPLKRTGLPLGIRPDTVYPKAPSVALAPGECVVWLTDGFEEATGLDDHAFGIERVFQILREHRTERAERIVASLFEGVHAFLKEAPQQDDFTVVVAKVK
jgi:sigma-B regulation protein RsbU (phosphoserine phosphatase)